MSAIVYLSATKNARAFKCSSMTASAARPFASRSGNSARRAWLAGTVLDDVARRRDERLVAVLLEKHPLQRLCAAEPLARHERRALGEVPEDRVRLGEMRAVVELERRNAAVQVAFQELRRPRRAGVDVELRPVVAQTELREQGRTL